jgi:hypothetical protein
MTQLRRIRPRIYATRPRPANPSTNLRLQGIAAALAVLARNHRQPDLAAMVLDSLGITLADLERAGADAYDLEPLQSVRPFSHADPNRKAKPRHQIGR